MDKIFKINFLLKIRVLLLFCSFILLGTSCKRTKSIVVSDAENNVKKMTEKQLFKYLTNVGGDIETLYTDSKVTYKAEKQKQSASMKMVVKKEELVWANVSFFIPVARALITPEKATVLNKLQRTYFEGNPKEMIGETISFSELQNLIIGLPFFPKNAYEEKINFLKKGFEISYLLTKDDITVSTKITLDSNLNIIQQEFKNSENTDLVSVAYSDFVQVSGKNLPSKIDVKFVRKGKTKELFLEHRKIEVNKKELKIPFKVPSGYKKQDF